MKAYGRLLLIVGALCAMPAWSAPFVFLAPQDRPTATHVRPTAQALPDPDQAEDRSDDDGGSLSDPLLPLHPIALDTAITPLHRPDVSYVRHHTRTLGSLLPARTIPADLRGPPSDSSRG